MSTIIAGHFQLQDEVDRARRELVSAGFPEDRISAFFVNQPGQHDLTPIGGDNMHVAGRQGNAGRRGRGRRHRRRGRRWRSARPPRPVTGPVGPIVGGLVGAHVGSLFSFSKMKEAGESEEGGENRTEPRKPACWWRWRWPMPADEARALEVLRRLGAHHIERADGTIAGWRLGRFRSAQHAGPDRVSNRASSAAARPARCVVCLQCAISTGSVIPSSTVRVAPPRIVSRKRECP